MRIVVICSVARFSYKRKSDKDELKEQSLMEITVLCITSFTGDQQDKANTHCRGGDTLWSVQTSCGACRHLVERADTLLCLLNVEACELSAVFNISAEQTNQSRLEFSLVFSQN